MRNPIRSRIIIVIVAALALPTGAAQDAPTPTFHSLSNGYTLSIPDGWTGIPDSAVQEYDSVFVHSPQTLESHVEAAFQRDGRTGWFAYPYAIVRVARYADGHQPDDSEIQETIKSVAGVDAEKLVRQGANAQAPGLISGASFDRPGWDRKTRILRIPVQLDVSGTGTVKGFLAAHFGRRALVCMNCYARSSDFASLEPTFSAINGSFRFDGGFEYDAQVDSGASRPKRVPKSATDVAGPASVSAMALALAVLAATAVGWVCMKLAHRSMRE